MRQIVNLRRAAIVTAVVAVAATGAALFYSIDPSHSAIYPRCVFHQLTGLDCPGCGTQRALHALLQGRIADALAFNALFVCGAPLVATIFAARWIRRGLGKPIEPLRAWWGWLLLIIVVTFGVARNLDIHPFNQLAPRAASAAIHTPHAD